MIKMAKFWWIGKTMQIQSVEMFLILPNYRSANVHWMDGVCV